MQKNKHQQFLRIKMQKISKLIFASLITNTTKIANNVNLLISKYKQSILNTAKENIYDPTNRTLDFF